MKNQLKFIGEIKTPYKKISECPPNISEDGPLCEIKIFSMYQDGLVGLKENDYILVLYWLDGAKREVEIGKPYHGYGDDECGTFALRSPHRPNPIGSAVIKIFKIKDNIITIKGLDCLTGTKLLDIKPAIYKECV